jgi:hypothetical protein
MRRAARLSGETISGTTVSFSYAAYMDAMRCFTLKDIEAVVIKVEEGAREESGVTGFLKAFGINRPKPEPVPVEVANFFRDFAIVQEADHPRVPAEVPAGAGHHRLPLRSHPLRHASRRRSGPPSASPRSRSGRPA